MRENEQNKDASSSVSMSAPRRDVAAVAGNGELQFVREVIRKTGGENGKHFAPPLNQARDTHTPRASKLPHHSASRVGPQSTNADPHARLPAAILWSHTATTWHWTSCHLSVCPSFMNFMNHIMTDNNNRQGMMETISRNCAVHIQPGKLFLYSCSDALRKM